MYETVWNNCLNFIKERISEKAFNTWFKPIIPLRIEDNVITIQVPNQFFYEWLEERYVDLLKQAIQQEMGQGVHLQYSILSDEKINKTTHLAINKVSQLQSPLTSIIGSSKLNPKYNLKNFIEGDCNRLAKSAGWTIAERPGTSSFNPLMIYGRVGLGKTHLVQAIGNEICTRYPAKKIVYVASEKFTNQFIAAYSKKRLHDFISYYTQTDLLILDDVQFFKDKAKTQEVYFHIFNHLHQDRKQIIMTSDCVPKDLQGLQERLVSRFKWGLTVELEDPDIETRMAILKQKIEEDDIKISEEVLEYIVHTVNTNIRELEGVAVSLIAHASLMRSKIDLNLAKKVLNNIIKETNAEINIEYIQGLVSKFYNLHAEDLKSKTRKKEVVIARQLAMFFSKDYTTHSLKSIGSHFGGRDHSTVIHALNSVHSMINKDSKFKTSVNELKMKLKMKTQ